jgi:hypothetical protein
MSYSVTGIQAIPASFPFPGTDQASAGTNASHQTKSATDQSNSNTVSLSATDTVSISTPDNFKALSYSSSDVPHVVGVLPVKVPGVVEPVDTVTLSTVDKVRSLRQQGEGDTQIAAALNLPIKEVQSDLHLETSAHLSFTVAPVVAVLTVNQPAAVSANS